MSNFNAFKVGDVCIVLGGAANWIQPLIGTECEIIGPFQPHHAGDGFLCRMADGCQAIIPPNRLRLRRPPSWDKWLYDTSGLTNDAPSKVPA